MNKESSFILKVFKVFVFLVVSFVVGAGLFFVLGFFISMGGFKSLPSIAQYILELVVGVVILGLIKNIQDDNKTT